MGNTNSEEEAPKLPRPVIDADECKSCGRCVAACPKKCLKLGTVLNNRGVYPVTYQGEGCIGCAVCFYNCPEPYAIKVQKA
ncbi:MAG: 4Fe-4S dicluster domain-containing protein [Kiritimatiellae bacterium]|nr:4Fe-4S dicluster domain-containing protein [Kiritimatiellia bacterium]